MITDEMDSRFLTWQPGELWGRSILHEEVRSYEVSIWTLQDEFITVLKWSNVEHKGRILNPKMELIDDGTQKFTFSIPMYYRNESGILVENPNWYNTRNGNLMINFRKIKVIFNKLEEDEKVFDFLITKITETHENDILTCEIETEGLAFHELGKIGYKHVLSLEEFDLDFLSYQENGYWVRYDGTQMRTAPHQNVLYWCNKIGLHILPDAGFEDTIDPTKWYYKIDMDWSSYPYAMERLTTIVYEEPYTISWEEWVPDRKILSLREKERTVLISESNLYNITQEIAKTFGIFCRYEYEYDEKYNIKSRTIIFFNNLIKDKNYLNKELLSFTYPHSSKNDSREIDSTDIVTKMYVRALEDSSTALGEANILDSEANMMLEDYILNFDYLYETGAITEELYLAFLQYLLDIRDFNLTLAPLQLAIVALEALKVELEAKITTYTNSVKLDLEQINANSALARELVSKYSNGSSNALYIDAYDANNPDYAMIITDSNGRYYINLNSRKKGIKTDTVHIYRALNRANTANPLSQEVTSFSFEYDEYGNPVKIYGVAPENNSNAVYMTYSYEPHLYYDAIVKTWTEKLHKDKVALEESKKALENLDENGEPIEPYGVLTLLERYKLTYESLLSLKKEYIIEFNELMGPAIREGYWLPEDYLDRGEKYSASLYFPNESDEDNYYDLNTEKGAALLWDLTVFEDELDIYYTTTINEEHVYYPCINLSSIYSLVRSLMQSSSNVSVMFNNDTVTTPQPDSIESAFSNIKNIRSFAIGSEAQLAFVITPRRQVYPALILVGAKSLTDAELERMRSVRGYISIGNLHTTVVNSNVIVTIQNRIPVLHPQTYWQFGNYTIDECQIVHPRIKLSSLLLKTDETNLFIKYKNELLLNYRDYNIRIDTRRLMDNDLGIEVYRPEYYITLKPEVMIRNATFTGKVSINYTLSNASTAIYLDALEIERENAYPKVSYTVLPNVLNKDIIHTLYNKLNYLVLINDVQLKFREVFGYISKLNLDLDLPQNDTIEVKNYKNKFEDLFSTIVALTEAMQKNEGLFSALNHGTYAIPVASLTKTFEANNNLMLDYLITNFLSSPLMNDYMSNLFSSAADVLSNSNNVLNLTAALTMANTSILNNFTNTIQNSLIPTTFRQSDPPESFKTGDLWILVELDAYGEEQETARWIATSDSVNSDAGKGLISGWSKTSNGSLATLAGPGVDVDPQTGEINLQGKNIGIIGSHSVNIGGVQVNITSNSTNIDTLGGINLVATLYDDENLDNRAYSYVKIHPNQVEMFASEINMLSGSVNENGLVGGSAVLISGEKGIWLGSTAGISLFSGSSDLAAVNGANIELKPTYILFGASSQNSGSAIKISPTNIIIATGTGTNSVINVETSGISGLLGGHTGIKITNNTFGIAALNNNTLNAMIMNLNGITIGSGVSSNTSGATLGDNNLSVSSGSYVRIKGNEIILSGTSMTLNASSSIALNGSNSSIAINGSGITMSSGASLSVSTDNVIINSSATGTNSIFELKKANGSGGYNTALKYSITNGLQISGSLTATGGNIGGWTIGSNYIGNSNSRDGSTIGMVNASSSNIVFWAGGIYNGTGNNAAPFRVLANGSVYLKSLIVDGQTVDFTKAFNDAVSFTGWWSGTTYYVQAQFYKNNSLVKSTSLSASAGVKTVTVSGSQYAAGLYNLTVTLSLKDDAGSTKTADILIKNADMTTIYSLAWKSAANTVSYTPGATTITVPNPDDYSGGQNSGKAYDISDTWNSGYRYAAGIITTTAMYLLPGDRRELTVPSTNGGTRVITIIAGTSSGGGNNGEEPV